MFWDSDFNIMSNIKRCLSQVSMIVFRANSSGERAWREEYLKYVLFMIFKCIFFCIIKNFIYPYA